MHIPDGYLSPESCGALGAAMVPVWATAGRRVRKVVKSRYVPLVAIGAAYSFLVMMFNLPIPDGTTAHAIGGVLIAVVLGPWAAVIAVSIALLIQALFFGDGGVLAYGANAFNMAFVMPIAGYGVYRALTRNVSLDLAAATVRGRTRRIHRAQRGRALRGDRVRVQPALFHSANGTPLYAPFHLVADHPGDGARAPHRRRFRRGRAHRGRDRVSPARESPAAAAQSRRRSRCGRGARPSRRASAGAGCWSDSVR